MFFCLMIFVLCVVPVVASDNETLPFPLQVTNDDTQPTNEISDPG